MTHETGHWKTRKIPQVVWVIGDIYNNLWKKTLDENKLLGLGDALDAEKLLQMQSPWSVIKNERNLTTQSILQNLKDGLNKTKFSTREIFMKWLNERDEQEYNYVWNREINYVLEHLNRASTYCNREWLNNNGMVVQEGTTSNIFQTLSLAFGESLEIMAEKIRKELTKYRGTLKYKQHDKKNWISRFLDNKTSASWDPLLFCVCANLFNCIVSIQNNGSEEYRIYPDGVSFTTIIKFGRVEVSKYVHLKCIREVFVGVEVGALYTCKKSTKCYDCLTMRETMEVQLARITGKENKPMPEQLLADHVAAVDGVIEKKEKLQKNVDNLSKELHQSKEKTGKLIHICGEISKAISKIDALKSEMDGICNEETQNQEHPDLLEHTRLNNGVL